METNLGCGSSSGVAKGCGSSSGVAEECGSRSGVAEGRLVVQVLV